MRRYSYTFNILTAAFLCFLLWHPGQVWSQSIINTVHNLSASGPGDIRASSESEVCIFCHTTHQAKSRSPLWNRQDPGASYNLYNSSVSTTLKSNPGQPDGSSILCLSCHDGTIALGNIKSRQQEISFARGISFLPTGKSNLGKDLSNDHPISFVYNASLSGINPELKDPSALQGPVKLENSKVQCTSCHDPHQNMNGDFLVATTEKSLLCLNCHQVQNWKTSAHSTSTATWTGKGANPWTHTPVSYNTVERNACENCHSPHHAGGRAQLVNFAAEESNCLNCHNGAVASASKNIQAQLTKTYRHDVSGYTQAHDASEPALANIKHVECSDCHNPHAVNASPANAPDIKGSLTGVRGINSSGMPVENAKYEYEVCFRCHSSNPATAPATQRQILQADTRLEFANNSISFHPVETKGRNVNMPGLISPLTENTMLYCTDCHASDGNSSPAGPHGSIYPQILKAQYSKSEDVTESASAYALCYSCHNRSEYNQDAGDNVRRMIHYKHVVVAKTSCNTCHDPHGISGMQGTYSNNSHLINFNTNVVSSLNGKLFFQDNGNRTGSCLLKCHGKSHNQLTY